MYILRLITDSLLLVIHWALDLNSCDYCKFQVTCTLGYFGFFCSEELTFTNMASFYTVQTLLTYLSLQENVCWPLTIVLT